MQSNSKIKIRSRVDVFKLKLDRVGYLLNNAFKQLDSHSNLKVKQITYDYLKWAQKELETLNRDSDYTENNKILRKISQFEAILDRNSNVDAASSFSIGEIVYGNIDSIKVGQNYGEFIENGVVFFKKVMDPSKLWFEELDSKGILANKEPDILSYTLIALIAGFTLPRNSVNYQQIYGKALRGVKATLPQAYSDPSYNHVVALGLLSFIGLYRLNFNFAKRYFLDAVRMAQCLGYNNNSLFDEVDVTDIRYKNLLQGRKVWKTLYLTYLVLSPCVPDMPFIKFEVKDSLHHFKQNQNYYNINKVLCLEISKENRWPYVRSLIEVNIKIATHVQRVKESYETTKDYSKIPATDLLLPQREFINCLTILINSIQDQKLTKDESEYSKEELDERVDDHEFNFKRSIKILIQYTIVTLYYPSVMAYPQPVPFTNPELKLLFNHASQVITFCLNKGLDKKFDRETFTRMYYINPKHKFQVNNIIPFYYQISHCFFALINLLHQPSALHPEDVYMIDESETKCLLFVKELDIISKSDNVKQAKDSINALNQIKYCIHRFQLSEDLTQKIYVYLNQSY